MAWLCLKSTCWVPVLSILLLSAPITLGTIPLPPACLACAQRRVAVPEQPLPSAEHESGPHARPRCNGWWRSTGAIQNVVGSAKGCVTRAAFSPPLKLGWTFPLSAAPSLSRSNSCRRVKGVGRCGEQSGALGMAMANRKKFWWKVSAHAHRILQNSKQVALSVWMAFRIWTEWRQSWRTSAENTTWHQTTFRRTCRYGGYIPSC